MSIKNIGINSTLIFISKIISYLLSFAYTIYLIRYLGPSTYGILAFALSLNSILGVLVDFGFNQLIIREIANDKELTSQYISNLSFIKLFLSIFVVIISLLILQISKSTHTTWWVVFWLTITTCTTSFTNMIYSFFYAFEKAIYASSLQILYSILMTVSCFTAIFLKLDIIQIVALYLLTALIILIISLYILKKFIIVPSLANFEFFRPKIKKQYISNLLKLSLPFALSMCFVMTFYWIDSIMLQLMKGSDEVGWYNAAYRIVMLTQIIPNSIILAIYPVMSQFYITNNKNLLKLFRYSLKYLTLLAVPMGVLVTFMADQIIILLFHQGYTNSVLPLRILIWSGVLIFISQPFGNLFNAINQNKLTTKITFVCVICNILMNFFLIPKLGMTGASIATVATEIISLLIIIIYSVKLKLVHITNRTFITLLKFTLLTIILMLPFILIAETSLLLALTLFLACYIVGLHYFKLIGTDDYKILKELIS